MRLNQIQFKNTYSKNPNLNFTLRRPYSTLSSPKEDNPIPVLTITALQDKDNILSKRELLLRKGGIYSFLTKLMESNI
jgi:hypothetical protein